MIWFRAMWSIVTQKYGANAMGLHRLLGFSYLTAWNLLHKLRRAMVRPGREFLSGTVEVDESYFGGVSEGTPGRGAENKALVVVAVELKGKTIGRIRMKVIDKATSDELIGFISETIEPNSTVITDGWSGYSNKILNIKGYTHQIQRPMDNSDILPHIHLIVSLAKRWLLGTLQGAVRIKYLDYYLDEFTFRFNRRKSNKRGKLFSRLIENSVAIQGITRKQISLSNGKIDSDK
jgi:transposase-like protein